VLLGILTVLPIFALVLTGFLASRIGALGTSATRELNRFVVYLALPALLFGVMARAELAEIWRPDLMLTLSGGMGVIFVVVLVFALRARRALPDATVDALSASYANTGFIGFPLIAALVGDIGLAPTLIAAILTACVLFAVALVLIELGRQRTGQGGSTLRALGSVATSPLLVAPALGAVVMLSGWHLPPPIESFVTLLGAAASPCALVTLGLFLAQSGTIGDRAAIGRVFALVALKLLAMPAVTWLIGGPLLHLDPTALYIAVLLASLPTGTGPFMLAELYGRDGKTAASTVLISTLASIVTLAVLVAVLAPGV
jgi:malonate transporter